MLGKILVVDQIATNRIAMRAKFGAAQFDVSQAGSLEDALSVIGRETPDLVVCDINLPDGSARDLIVQLTRTMKSNKPPVVVLSENMTEAARLELLAAGANDAIAKPIDNMLLLARIRSHVRAAHADVEWRLRDDTSRAFGLGEAQADFVRTDSVRLIGRDEKALDKLANVLKDRMPNTCFAAAPPEDILSNDPASQIADAFVLMVKRDEVQDMLGLLSTLRCHRDSRHAAIFVLQEEHEAELAAFALDMGASDLVATSASASEIALRLRALLQKKRQSDQLRATVRTGLEAAIYDPLTGLHNRRYAIPHLARLVDRSMQSGMPVTVMVADMDHFKRINDTHGHAAGDLVLAETAKRLRENLRAEDLVARIGGEEFLIVLPGVTLENARKAGERLCRKIRDTPFALAKSSQELIGTISIGMTVFDPTSGKTQTVPSPETLLDQADKALYNAKAKGRNRVLLAKPAA